MSDYGFLISGAGLFALLHTGILIWHLSKMSTTLAFIRTDLERAMSDFERRNVKHDSEVSTIFKRIDENKALINNIIRYCKDCSGTIDPR